MPDDALKQKLLDKTALAGRLFQWEIACTGNYRTRALILDSRV